jgi:hypothetical protein
VMDSRARRALERRRVQMLVGLALPQRRCGRDTADLRGGQRLAGAAVPRRDLHEGERRPGPRAVAAQARPLSTQREA